ncbi:MAG: ABC transporter ATP-binding protein [Armatimonadetes bacterium]|nr:ABC transporter ATP-binding protein [Armatimonadota bacterium]
MTAGGTHAIQAKGFGVAFGSVVALEDVTFGLGLPGTLLLAGPSGCGKSTLILALGGIVPGCIPADRVGSLTVAGRDAGDGASVACVFQDPGTQLLCPTVRDEVASGLQRLGLGASHADRRVTDAMAALGLEPLADRRPGRLSAGEQQRVTLAAALAMRPEVLALDEPTAHLDEPGCADLYACLEQQRVDGPSLVVAEHRWDRLPGLAGQVLALEGGKQAAWGDAPGALPTVDLPRRPPSAPGDVLLRTDGLGLRVGGRLHLRDVTLTVAEGEVVAVVGRNGVGKSLLARALAGLTRPAAGSVTVRGRRPRPGIDVGMVMQGSASQLFCDNVRQEVGLGPMMAGRPGHTEVDVVLEQLGVLHLAERSPHRLSRGEAQRVLVAAALALAPPVIVLDEPGVGQDAAHLRQVATALKAHTDGGGAALLMTHDETLAEACADRLLRAAHGTVRPA